jgi:hypothetical protein
MATCFATASGEDLQSISFRSQGFLEFSHYLLAASHSRVGIVRHASRSFLSLFEGRLNTSERCFAEISPPL